MYDFRCARKVKVRQSFATWPNEGEMKSNKEEKVKHSREDIVDILLASDISGAGLKNSCGFWL